MDRILLLRADILEKSKFYLCIPCEVNKGIFKPCFFPQPNKVSEGPIANESKGKSEKVQTSTKAKQRKLKTANKSQAYILSTTKTTQTATESTSTSKHEKKI